MFGLHAPHTLTDGADPRPAARGSDLQLCCSSLIRYQAETSQNVLMEAEYGRLCIEAKTTLDLEWTLRVTAGNISTER